MIKTLAMGLLPLFVLLNSSTMLLFAGSPVQDDNNGVLEKMIVSGGSVRLDLDLKRLNGNIGIDKRTSSSSLNFSIENNSFFPVLVFNGEVRAQMPGSMKLISENQAQLPGRLATGYQQLVIERPEFGENYELIVRDAQTGFIYFNIEGQEVSFAKDVKSFEVSQGRLLLSPEFAAEIGKTSEIGNPIGGISIKANMQTIEITHLVEGKVEKASMPSNTDGANTPGPDVIVGDLVNLAQYGSAVNGQVGLAVGTDSCNNGTVDLNWFALPANDHPVIPQNLYRMSGGSDNAQRFEQIGQSSVKHGFTALTQNLCGFGCNGVGGSRLGSGCSDPYSSSLNSGPNLGSRAWINPFTGAFPRGDSTTPPNSHGSHSHNSTSHRILTNVSDLVPAQNPGATYYAEAQYVTPHEYTWCQSNPTQCNMYNNVSYRRYNVSGTSSFSFSPVGSTVRIKAAVEAWPDATFTTIEPSPGQDGVGIVAYKVTNPSAGVWHYEYAIYNQNIDRAIRQFNVPVGTGASVSNVGFHAPPQHPGSDADGTRNNAGYSSTPWTSTQTGGAVNWATQTMAENENANAIRWGTMYNFRFDSNRPPQTVNATIGFLKTGEPITVQVQAPSASSAVAASISGRVTYASGTGLGNAKVTITDGVTTRSYITGAFGYYSFENLSTGTTYTISVGSKRFTYTPQTVTPSQPATTVNFVAN